MKGVAVVTAAAMAVVMGAQAFAHEVSHVSHIVTIKCYRGPSGEVIWDRPEPIFLESLMAYGYTPTESLSMAQQMCRDPGIIGNESAQKAKLINMIRNNPPRQG